MSARPQTRGPGVQAHGLESLLACWRSPAETAAATSGVVAVARKLKTTKLNEKSAVFTPSAPCE